MRVLLTGSSGLIGSALLPRLATAGVEAMEVDLRASDPAARIDICDSDRLLPLVEQADGILHFAAVSRVVDGEKDPERCMAVNVEATRRLLAAALASKRTSWFINASSREVYGQQAIDTRVAETAPFRPMNVYARTKVAGEELTNAAAEAGLKTAIVRFSSAYGSPDDHATRVVPAFVAAAVRGEQLRVEGRQHTFDLTHVDDVANGLERLVAVLDAEKAGLPPIHFVSGTGTTLGELAARAIALGSPRATAIEAAPRSFDIHHFIGDPARAKSLLGWQATTSLDAGLARLAADYRTRLAATPAG